MKARVKVTEEIWNFSQINELTFRSAVNGRLYSAEELEFLEPSVFTPDYWEKLKHQYAGMAMQGLLSNCEFPAYSTEGYYKENIANNALEYATALISKLKED